VQDDVVIPRSIAPIAASFSSIDKNTIEASIPSPPSGDLRIIFQQRGTDGTIMRSWPGGPPNGTTVGKVLKISATQDGKPLAIQINYDKQVWSGLSWGAGEINHASLLPNRPMTIRCSSAEKGDVRLNAQIYLVQY